LHGADPRHSPPNSVRTHAKPRRRTFFEWIADLFGSEDSGAGRSVLRLLAFVWFMMGIGLASLVVPALAQVTKGNWPQALAIFGVGLFLAGAATAAGSFLGFLFGVPKASPSHSPGHSTPSTQETLYEPNTNLEIISDWLTKAIVGVGLVEVRQLITWLDQVGQLAGGAMGGSDMMRVIATSLLIHYLLMGFFQGFLVAYLYLPKVFAAARRSAEQSTVDGPQAAKNHLSPSGLIAGEPENIHSEVSTAPIE
jgi:hypothetical protein